MVGVGPGAWSLEGGALTEPFGGPSLRLTPPLPEVRGLAMQRLPPQVPAEFSLPDPDAQSPPMPRCRGVNTRVGAELGLNPDTAFIPLGIS